MAIDYALEVAVRITPDRLLCIVEDELGLDHERDPKRRSPNPTLLGRGAPGFYLTALSVDPGNAKSDERWLGFGPATSLGFRMDKLGDMRAAYLRVLRATSAVLERVQGDAALVLNGEYVCLIRKDGRTTVRRDPSTHDAEALSIIRVPYQIGEMPRP